MAKRNYLVEGSSGTGKSAVWEELRKRGYTAINGDRELAYRGDPETGRRSARQHGPTEGPGFGSHIWDVDKVREIASKTDDDVAFFCGGSRNFRKFLDVFDKVFVLDADIETLRKRLDRRTAEDWDVTDPANCTDFVLRLHVTKENLPEGITINTARPIGEVVDALLELTKE
jgi:broad-specificity NMP kinase